MTRYDRITIRVWMILSSQVSQAIQRLEITIYMKDQIHKL